MEILVISGLLLLALVYLIVSYNRLVQLRNRYQNQFSQIDVQLKRRYDLIPNLVSTAKAYLKHEQETLQKVTEARNQARSALDAVAGRKELTASGLGGIAKADGLLSQAMAGLQITMEAYPDLKASHNMMQLSEELTNTENRVSYARQAYNDSVQMFNEKRQSFPVILFASAVGFSNDAPLLVFEDAKEIAQRPEVAF